MDNQPKTTASQVTSVVNLPGYKIIDVLGKGGMAVVYLAIQESIGRQVALKILAPDHTDETFTDRFLREARIISNLTHPNIITVYDANVHQGCHYMSMEYVPGNSLREARDKLTRKQKVDVIKQVARALDYAGKKGYVHRDIKPENILLHEDGRAILTDFGIARSQNATTGLTITGKVIGTPYYMSPEQTKGIKVDHRSDIYSLGIVLFQALAGHLPYDGPSFVAIGIKHLSDPIPELPKGLEIFQPIINTCMSKDPSHRYQTANELIDALGSLDDADLDFIEARQTTTQKSGVRPGSQHHSRTIPSDSMPPVVSARPKKKKTSSRIIPDELSAPSGDLDVTASDDFKRLNRRKRFILILLMICLAGLGYYKRTELTHFYYAELAPLIEPYIDKYIRHKTTQSDISDNQSVTASPTTSDQTQESLSMETTPLVDNNASVADTGTSDNLSETAEVTDTATSLTTQLSGQSAESIKQLTQQYSKQLQADPKNSAARAGLSQISDWYVLQTLNAFDNNDNARARMLITQADSTLPRAFYPRQLVEFENRLLRRETIETHLQQARKYMDEGNLVVPAGQNAVDELNEVFSIEPNNTVAKQYQDEIIAHYYKKTTQELDSGKLRDALASVELGLTVVNDDQRLLNLKHNVQKKIEIQEQVATLLKLAETQLQAGKAVEPAGESAIYTYNEVLKLQPDNRYALTGIKHVEEYAAKQIQTAIWENKLAIGQRILKEALRHFPNSSRLDQAGKKLQTTMSERAPRITHMIISDHSLSSLLTEQAQINVTPMLHLGFTYTNFSKETTILNVKIISMDEQRQIVNKKLLVSDSSGEQIFSVKHPLATFIHGQYRVLITLKNKELINQLFTIQPENAPATVTITQ